MFSNNVSTDRRAAASHPGPRIKRDYFDALGIDVATFAANAEMDRARLEAMLSGDVSIDVDAAIRLSRVLQISADAIMRMQMRADFASARASSAYDRISILRPEQPPAFPESGTLRGRLGLSVDTAGDPSYFFQEDISAKSNVYAGLHALFRGDRIRVYQPDGSVRWTGTLLHGLDGRLHLPYVHASEWPIWFDDRAIADLAIGEEHAAFFARMGTA